MVPRRTLLLSLGLLLGTATHAWSACPGGLAPVALPNACAGETVAGSASLCFAPDSGCLGVGMVIAVLPPGPPFTVTGVHVDGPLGSRIVGDGDFPVLLLPGESMVADVTAALGAPGDVRGRFGWIVSTQLDDLEHGDICAVDVRTAMPTCAGPSAANPCLGEVCVAGACVPGPVAGPCEDGDPCTVGDTCLAGVCQPGFPADCSANPCAIGSVCVAGACVGGTPVSCADANPCTVDSCDPVAGCLHVPSDALCQTAGPCMIGTCDPVRGCIQTPLTGPACDDGNACTTGDHCAAGVCQGSAVQCSDGVDCTDDRCGLDGACQHVPVDARCGSDECTAGACRPGDPGADRHGCVSVPVSDGEACTDDGVACTDDVCTAGGCLHVPIDSRCNTDQCQPAVCAPERRDSDASGCATGPAPATGAGDAGASGGGGTGAGGAPAGGGDPGGATGDVGEGGKKGGKGDKDKRDHDDENQDDLTSGAQQCAEDGDPCTDDVCSDGRCVHTPVPQAATCDPVKGAFRKALGLAALTRTLMATAQGAHAAAARPPGMSALGRVEQDLEGAVLALSGKTIGALIARPASIAETPAQARARIAFTRVLRTPRQIQSFLSVVAQARARAELGQDTSRTLRRRGRLLLRGTKTLKGELRRLRQVTQTFAR